MPALLHWIKQNHLCEKLFLNQWNWVIFLTCDVAMWLHLFIFRQPITKHLLRITQHRPDYFPLFWCFSDVLAVYVWGYPALEYILYTGANCDKCKITIVIVLTPWPRGVLLVWGILRSDKHIKIARMSLGGPGCRLQTCSCLAAEWFNSTFRAKKWKISPGGSLEMSFDLISIWKY